MEAADARSGGHVHQPQPGGAVRPVEGGPKAAHCLGKARHGSVDPALSAGGLLKIVRVQRPRPGKVRCLAAQLQVPRLYQRVRRHALQNATGADQEALLHARGERRGQRRGDMPGEDELLHGKQVVGTGGSKRRGIVFLQPFPLPFNARLYAADAGSKVLRAGEVRGWKAIQSSVQNVRQRPNKLNLRRSRCRARALLCHVGTPPPPSGCLIRVSPQRSLKPSNKFSP